MKRPALKTLSHPPRKIPVIGIAQLLFSGALHLFGWSFVVFGMLFVLMFGLFDAVFVKLETANGVLSARGHVTAIEETNVELGVNTVYATHFTFKTANGKVTRGKSYSTSQELRQGYEVNIEYVPHNPSLARIQGQSWTKAPLWIGILTLFFPLIGLGFISMGFRRGWKAYRLMVRGCFAEGKLENVEETQIVLNNQDVVRMTFRFRTEDGRYFRLKEDTYIPKALLDEKTELLLYHPKDPNQGIMVDNLPGKVSFGADGQFVYSFAHGALGLIALLLILGLIAPLLFFGLGALFLSLR